MGLERHYHKMATTLFVRFLLVVSLLPSGLGRSQVPCEFSIPSTNASGSCDTYDLSSIASMRAWTYYDAARAYNYTFSLCDNVPSASLPQSCKNISQAVAYVYVNATGDCYRLGSLDSSYVVRFAEKSSRER